MAQRQILTLNAGSSSIKFAVFDGGASPQRILSGQVERIGEAGPKLVARRHATDQPEEIPIPAAGHGEAGQSISDYLRRHLGTGAIAAIGHRIVHGGIHLLEHQRITPAVMAELKKAQPLDLAHLTREISLIETFQTSYRGLPQIACFDTAFHRDLPRVSQLLPIPREFLDAGVRRLGFHGLSFTYLMQRLAAVTENEAARGRVLLAHLGAGASLAAVRDGKPIDTTMAFTPTAGLVMAARPGDLDPGLLIYLMRRKNLSLDEADQFISSQCGMIGVSQTSGDMRDLLARRGGDSRAAEAVDLFCYQAVKHAAAMIAAMGGLDMLVFSGGIGEHAPEIRAAICDGLRFLGTQLDPAANARGNDVISNAASRTVVRVIPTDEEFVIAQIVRAILG